MGKKALTPKQKALAWDLAADLAAAVEPGDLDDSLDLGTEERVCEYVRSVVVRSLRTRAKIIRRNAKSVA